MRDINDRANATCNKSCGNGVLFKICTKRKSANSKLEDNERRCDEAPNHCERMLKPHKKCQNDRNRFISAVEINFGLVSSTTGKRRDTHTLIIITGSIPE
mmetsp:Transcript_28726/g.57298  ORF Transcript_28726/g.57298 Transcript_28726/m.57298 type:complete len:100 (-) Transcript_28726:205-504(-)